MSAGIIGAIALKKPGLAAKTEGNLTANLGEELIKVRHHTSFSSLKGIKNSGSINASRGLPYPQAK
ncbi:hypothetical protein ACFQO9_09400 [Chryseobacterium zhengzhouense]|uniref:Uncharacterized protein n=1 Tax=Chryseobacterium zhengzhouense TaxID=1636086 RepID=A0ABW2LYW0_9FLAO